MSFKDHFSGHAAGYRDARPHYDAALFAWLAAQVTSHELAWDVGCGNGQASVALAPYFARVIATDPSAPQIANAEARDHVEYRVEPAERSSLTDASADLVAVAQALHWFDLEHFYAEVRRVLKPGGLIAAWTYAHTRIAPALDSIVDRLYTDIVGAYWPPERKHTENGYASLPFPFAQVAVPPFELVAQWDLSQFLAYLRTWSSTQRYIKANGHDPVTPLEAEFAAAWGEAEQVRAVSWQLAVRAGRV